MDNELTFVLNTTDLKAAGFEGSFNEFADEIAEMDAIVSGTYDEDGAPVITIVGISPEELQDKLSAYGVEDASGFIEPVEPATVEGGDLDTEANVEENDNDDPELEENEPSSEEDEASEEDEEEIEIIEDEDVDEIENLHDQEEELHDQEEDIHDQEEEIAPDDEEIELHDEEEHIHDEEEERHDEIEEEISESNKPKGTQNISESLMAKILADVKDTCLTKRINERLKVYEDMKDNLSESTKPVTIYLNSWSNNKVNGVEIWKYRNTDIVDLLAETKKSYKSVYKRYKSLNESNISKRKDYVAVLRKQKALIEMLESEYRFRNINEEELQTSDTSNVVQDNPEDNQQEDTQEMNLTAIVFKVKDADEFIKVMTDHGIPAEAFKKGAEKPADDGSDGSDQQDTQQPEAAAPAPDAMSGAPAAAPAPAPGANPFESVTTPLTKKNKLNEDGNPFDQLADPGAGQETTLGDPDQPGATDGVDPLNSDESADLGDGEEVILTDTSYASQVQKVLEDVYGYAKKDFEDKIGGELVDEDNPDESQDDNPFNEVDGSDGSENDDTDPTNSSNEKNDGYEESISPADIFGDL